MKAADARKSADLTKATARQPDKRGGSALTNGIDLLIIIIITPAPRQLKAHRQTAVDRHLLALNAGRTSTTGTRSFVSEARVMNIILEP